MPFFSERHPQLSEREFFYIVVKIHVIFMNSPWCVMRYLRVSYCPNMSDSLDADVYRLAYVKITILLLSSVVGFVVGQLSSQICLFSVPMRKGWRKWCWWYFDTCTVLQHSIGCQSIYFRRDILYNSVERVILKLDNGG